MKRLKLSETLNHLTGRLLAALCVLSLLSSGPQSWAAILAPTLIEVSGGEDASEWVALAHSVRSKDIDVVGIVVQSPSIDSRALKLALRLREALNRPDIPLIHGSSEAVPECPFELWETDKAGGAGEVQENLASEVLALIEKYSGNLQILSTGSLASIVSAWEQDPSSLSKLRRILISGVTIDQNILGGVSEIEGKAGDLLLASSAPLVLFPQDLNRTIRFSREDQITLSKARTPLTDSLTYLVAREAQSSNDHDKAWEEGIPFDHALMVTYAFHPPAGQLEKRMVSVGNSAGKQVEALVAVDCKPDLIIGNMIFNLTDPMIDFGLGFSHYLFNLGRLSSGTKKLVSDKLKNLPAPAGIADGSAIAKERIRQVLDYLESSLQCFDGIDADPTADAAIDSLLDTYQKVASIGWLFPDSFYHTWSVEVSEDEDFEFSCGVSNPQGRNLRDLSISSSFESKTSEPKLIDSATEDVDHEVGGELPKLIVSRQFECAGNSRSSTMTLELSGATALEVSRRD